MPPIAPLASPQVPAPAVDAGEPGERLRAFVEHILPFRRCITGDGLRQTLLAIGEHVPLRITEVSSGTSVLDWTVPREWRVREAYIATEDGTRVIDWAESPLHLVHYSVPARDRMPLWALRSHLHTLPEQPDLVPYRMSYDAPAWGFCLSQERLDALAEALGEGAELEVVVDTEVFDGSLTYGEVVVPGATVDEILIYAHACRPALANDTASGLAVATALARRLLDGPALRHTVRFLFAPETLGAIAWLDKNHASIERVRHGLVLADLGGRSGFTYHQTRRGTFEGRVPVDRAVAVVLRDRGEPVDVRPFDPTGGAERQFASPGFDLPVGRLARTPHGASPGAPASGDDLDSVDPDRLAGALDVLTDVVHVLDADGVYRNTQPFGEPHLGRRGFSGSMSGEVRGADAQQAALWVLNLSDGRFSLLDVAEQSGLPFAVIRDAASALVEAGLLQPVG